MPLLEYGAYASPTSMSTSNSRCVLRFRKQRSRDRISQGSYNHYVRCAETTKVNLHQVFKFWSDSLRQQSRVPQHAVGLVRCASSRERSL